MATATVKGSKKTSEYSVSSNPNVTAINKARAQNVASGKSAYSGGGATRASASAGKGGYAEGGDYSNLPDFGGTATPANHQETSPKVPEASAAGATAPEATQPVSTPAASPTPVQGEVSYDQAQKNLAGGGLTGGALQTAQQSLASRYQQGHAAANASGAPPPADAGAARSGVSSYLPPEAPQSSVVDDIFANDPIFNQMMTQIADSLNPKKGTTSLMQDYRALYKESNLGKINDEMIDIDTVINGQEDAIRNEIQTAGGIGTEQQVMAMTFARNKSLLQRYNALAQSKTDATNNLNTMLQLTQQDKQMTEQRLQNGINNLYQAGNYRQNMIKATQDTARFAAQQDPVGYYQSMAQDPRQLAFAEKILGTGSGGLQRWAQSVSEQKAYERSIQQAQLDISKSNNALGWANLGENQRQFNQKSQATNLTPTQQKSITDIDSLQSTIQKVRSLGEETGWNGVGGFGIGTARQLGTHLFGFGSSKDEELRNQISNLKGTIALARGGTSFTANEQALLESYTPTINDSPKQIQAKLSSLDATFSDKRNSIFDVASGNYSVPIQGLSGGDTIIIDN